MNNIKSHYLQLDMSKSEEFRTISIWQGENKSNQLDIDLTHQFQSYNPAITKIVILYDNEYGIPIVQSNATYTDGKISCTIPDGVYQSIGKVRGQISLYNGEIKTQSGIFFIEVRQSVGIEVMAGRPEWGELDKAFEIAEKAEEWKVQEEQRKTNELDRVKKENNRNTAESARISAENTRASQESGRVSAENTRVSQESGRVTSFNNIKKQYEDALALGNADLAIVDVRSQLETIVLDTATKFNLLSSLIPLTLGDMKFLNTTGDIIDNEVIVGTPTSGTWGYYFIQMYNILQFTITDSNPIYLILDEDTTYYYCLGVTGIGEIGKYFKLAKTSGNITNISTGNISTTINQGDTLRLQIVNNNVNVNLLKNGTYSLVGQISAKKIGFLTSANIKGKIKNCSHIIGSTGDSMINNGLITTASTLNNKIWLVIGDSITEKNFRTTKNYHDYIKDKVVGLTVANDGKSGTGYATAYSGMKAIYERIDNYSFNPDIISVFAGTNDWTNTTLDLGVFGDKTPITLYGYIYATLTKLINKYPLKPIVTFTPLQRIESYGEGMNNAKGFSLFDVAQAVKRVSASLSIPCLDLYSISNLKPFNSANNDYYFKASNQQNPDGLHPNDNGHKERLAPLVKEFLEKQLYT